MRDFVKLMKALSDPTRVKILKALQSRSMCVCEMYTALNLAQPTISKHLKILEEAGLVAGKKNGLWVNYSLTDGRSSPYAAALLGNLRHWLDDDPEIMRLLKSLPGVSREEICKKNGGLNKLVRIDMRRQAVSSR